MKKERLWLLLFAIVFSLLTLVPYLFMQAGAPSGSVFLYTMGNNYDQASYQAWIKQAEEGKIFAGSNYTTEPQSGLFFNPFFYLCGNYVKLTGLNMLPAYQLIRMLLVVALVLMLYKFSEIFLSGFKERFFFTVLTSFSGGFGFLIPNAGLKHLQEVFNIVSLDLWVPESNIFITCLQKPLFMAALILMLLVFYFLLKGFVSLKKSSFFAAAGALFLLGLTHPYDLATVYGALTVYLFWSKADRKRWYYFLGAAVLSSPALIYEYMLNIYDPFFREWGKTVTLSSTIYSYLLGYGFVLLAALAYMVKRWNKFSRPELFLLSWVFSHLIMAYMPVRFERRLLLGLAVPLCLLAALWFYKYFIPFMQKNSFAAKKILPVAAILLIVPSNIRYVYEEYKYFVKYSNNYCLPAGDYKAFSWMDKNVKRDSVIFAFYSSGVYMPGLTGCKVYAGHYDQTLDAVRKKKETGVFFETRTPDTFRVELLAKSKAEYLYFGSFEKHIGDPGFDLKSYLSKVYDKDGVKIYKVK
ncbi:MAG: hypothetical protein NTX32_00145 [Candidatus Firestonebacteria bacterium]|nr:hypothetical protein [Candidatus Firestonebacteria bacterium]